MLLDFPSTSCPVAFSSKLRAHIDAIWLRKANFGLLRSFNFRSFQFFSHFFKNILAIEASWSAYDVKFLFVFGFKF